MTKGKDDKQASQKMQQRKAPAAKPAATRAGTLVDTRAGTLVDTRTLKAGGGTVTRDLRRDGSRETGKPSARQ